MLLPLALTIPEVTEKRSWKGEPIATKVGSAIKSELLTWIETSI